VTEETLPALNATLNGIATMLLVVAWLSIRRRSIYAHAYLMISAFIVSAVFLFFYLLHKYLYGDRGTEGLEPQWVRLAYLFVLLLPHVVLAAVMLPMILATFWQAWRRNWDAHRRIARPTFWIWLYVSVTGVLIYVLLYHVFPRMIAH
jgi:putative membrane protein